MNFIDTPAVSNLIQNALAEDVGGGDITSTSTIPPDRQAYGRFIAKEDGILCGIDIAAATFAAVDKSVVFRAHFADATALEKGDVIAEVSGNARSMLTAERVALNLMQHMSAVSTATKKAVDAVAGYKAKITDTRKTTPCMRMLEKYAVVCGGGINHRYNLSDGVLIKDNHIVAAGSITNAVNAARSKAPHTLKIEVETETLDQVAEAIAACADIIMLDNMDCRTMTEAVKLIDGRAVVEASGNMGEKNLASVAACGVDYISIGALTHSVKALDISLKFTLI